MLASLEETMCGCGDDAMELTTQFVGDQMSPVEARRIYNFWATNPIPYPWHVTWMEGDVWRGLRSVKNHMNGKIELYVTNRLNVAICTKPNGDRLETDTFYKLQTHIGTCMTAEDTVRELLDYRWAPKCGGNIDLPVDDDEAKIVRMYDPDEEERYDVEEDHDEFEVRRPTVIRCPNIVHHEGALCGACLQHKFFKDEHFYANRIEIKR
jgi:hypothetical protein